MMPLRCIFPPAKRADDRQPCRRIPVLACLLAALVANPSFGEDFAEQPAGGGNQGKSWLARLTGHYEVAHGRAEAIMAKARASVANSRSIHARAMSSENAEIRARASKALLDAEAVQKKALANLLAAQSALAILRGGPPEFATGVPPALVVLGEDAHYAPGDRSKPKAAAFWGIAPGDRLETGSVGKARLHLLDGELESEIQLASDSRLVAQNGVGDEAAMQLILQQGAARIADIARTPAAQAAAASRKNALDASFNCLETEKTDYAKCAFGYLKGRVQKRFEVRTPSAVLAVRGTEYVLAHDEATGATLIKVLEGEVALLSDRLGQALLVGAGQGARADFTGLSLLEAGVDVTAERRRWEE